MKKSTTLLAVMTCTMVIAAGIYAFLLVSNHRAAAAVQDVYLFPELDAITAISYDYDGEDIALVLQDGEWVLSADPKRNISQDLPREMCRQMTGLITYREVTESPDFSAFGLESPSMVIRVTADTGDYALTVGALNTNSREYYAVTGTSDSVHMISQEVLPHFQKNTADLYEPPVPVSLYYTYADAFTCRDAAGETVRYVKEDGQWKNEATADPMDAEALADLLKPVCTMKVVETITAPEDLSVYGLDQPVQEITLEDEYLNITIFFGGDAGNGQQYVRYTGTDRVFEDCVYTIDSTILSDFTAALPA